MTTKVVNKYKDSYDVYIGRGSVFGNPFVIGRDGTREDVINKYRDYFLKQVHDNLMFKSQVLKLEGKTLGCFCKPKACHGDVIKEYLENQ